MNGDSLRRQTEAREEYATEHDLIIDYSLHLQDLGISAYHGKHVTEGKLAGFFTAIQTGHVSAGSILLVESLGRLSREQVTEALMQLSEVFYSPLPNANPRPLGFSRQKDFNLTGLLTCAPTSILINPRYQPYDFITQRCLN